MIIHYRIVSLPLLSLALRSPLHGALAMAFLLFSTFVCALRWHLLTSALGMRLKWSHTLGLTFVGNFFNTVMPGSIGGDLVKAASLATFKKGTGQVPIGLLSIVLDRLVGFCTMLLLTTMAEYAWPRPVPLPKELGNALVWISWAEAAGLVSLLFFFTLSSVALRVERGMKHYQNLPGMIVVKSLLEYRKKGWVVFRAFVLSFVSLVATLWLYQIQGEWIGMSVRFADYARTVPLGLVASSVPLLPGGIGVGQLAFFKLFALLKNGSAQDAATLCTVIQAYTIVFNCFGGLAYFFLPTQRAAVHPNRRSSSRPLPDLVEIPT